MKLKSILSEVLRNIGSGTAHACAMFLAVFIAGTLLGGYEAMSVVGIENEVVTRIGAYADTQTVLGSGDVIDGVVCDRLADGGGTDVGADGRPSYSGAMRIGSPVILKSTPGKEIASYEVSPGMIGMLTAGNVSTVVDVSGIWVSTDVARNFGLAADSMLETTAGKVRVAGVFDWPNDGRDTRFAYAILVPVAASGAPFSECWAKQWPANVTTEKLLYSTVISDGSGKGTAGVMALNKGYDAHYSAQRSYHSRSTRWIPYLGLILGLMIGAIAVRRRRLEYAGALHSGQSKGAQLLGMVLETLVWGGLGTIGACSLLTTYCVRASYSDYPAVLYGAVRAPLAIFAGAMLTTALTGLTIRESQLFRYFKRR